MTISEKLKELMREKNITAKELVELCQPWCQKYNEKLDKSYISRYLSGDVVPKLKKLSILALALNTNEAYLMGLIPSKESQKNETLEIKEVVDKLKKLDLYDLGRISAQIDMMLEANKYDEQIGLKTA